MLADPSFKHREAAQHALAFRQTGDVAELVALPDDPHPCVIVDLLFAAAGSKRAWLNWVPMPSEAISSVGNEIGGRRAKGEDLTISDLGLSAGEPPSALAAFWKVAGPVKVGIGAFPPPDIRAQLRPGTYAVWRWDGEVPVPVVPTPSDEAVRVLHEVGGEAWPSLLSGYLQAAPLGERPLADLLGLLGHVTDPPATTRWEHLAGSTPTYWHRLAQAWVCLGLLHHAPEEPWATSTRRQVLVDLAFGVEDWVADAALFALVTTAFREPGVRVEVHDLVRARLEAAVAAADGRVVTILESLAELMLITPGCDNDDRALATACLAEREATEKPRKRRWWRRR
ncbi:hypothetical protein [Antribacter gilvus]|uniref:hypothetical protein n=1 Tax=Antribacter gilvus TaxID=2304675 RepID=UPI00197EFD84|nr:hypothetical protein [Antribacter gilvus]